MKDFLIGLFEFIFMVIWVSGCLYAMMHYP